MEDISSRCLIVDTQNFWSTRLAWESFCALMRLTGTVVTCLSLQRRAALRNQAKVNPTPMDVESIIIELLG